MDARYRVPGPAGQGHSAIAGTNLNHTGFGYTRAVLILPAMHALRLRSRWTEMPNPAVVTPPLLAPSDATTMRAFFDAEAPAPRDSDAGRYGELDEHDFPSVVRGCRAVAESIVTRALSLEQVRLQRFGAGDFLEPEPARAPAESCLELTLDFSARASGTGGLVYLHDGRPTFEVSQTPGVIALVERGPASTRRVAPLADTETAVYRLVVELAYAP